MLGAIAGDVIGSVHEFLGEKTADFPLFVQHSRFTDDSVLTIAVADCLLTRASYVDKFDEYARAYPDCVYGAGFWTWVQSASRAPYNSWGNGAAMRVSPVGFAFDTLEDVLREARTCAEVTHNHPEGVRGAQATAVAIFLAREGETKEAITAFLDASDYEETIRLAISLGGDADTLACIAGGIAEAFYGGVPKDIAENTMAVLDDKLRQTVQRFRATFLNLAG